MVPSWEIRTNFYEFAFVFLHGQVAFHLLHKPEIYKKIEKVGQASFDQNFKNQVGRLDLFLQWVIIILLI